jgi:hypothetical protein
MQYIACSLLAILAACRGDLSTPKPLEALDEPYFRCRVQPILTKDCSMFACHGDGRRYLRLYARDRLRLGLAGEDQRNAMMTADERAANFDAARAFVDDKAPGQSLLVLKPLAQSAGGYFHRGETIYGQGNVFLTTKDPDYKTLLAWVGGAKDKPGCIEPGSDQ